MALTIFDIQPAAILAICIMIVALVLAHYKKWMMTYALIIANIVVFIITLIRPDDIIGRVDYFTTNGSTISAVEIVRPGLGFRAIYLTSDYFPQIYTLFTSMFVHSVSNIWHIVGNMFVFIFIGTALEERIGWKKFIIIYLISGIGAAIAQSIINFDFPYNFTTLIGASGAIFGIMGAIAYSYPRDEIVMPIPLGIIMVVRRVKAIYAVILFATFETIIVIIGSNDNTAHFAHIGGMITGFILAAILIGRNKTHTKKGQTIYYDSYVPLKVGKIDTTELKKLATTPELKEMLKKIEKEDVIQVRDVWLEHFLEKAVCPKCKKNLNHFDGKIWCEFCGYKSKY